jgi:large subunit ribosomal protein L15
MKEKRTLKKVTLKRHKHKPPPKKTTAGLRPPEIKLTSIGLHSLVAPFGARRRKKLLGRGSSSGHGKTSTRGSKGQTSRAGRDFYLGFEGGQTPLIRRIPKRGFTSKFKKDYQIVNLGELNKLKDLQVTPQLLEERGLIKDKNRWIKILGEGELSNPLTIQAHAFSKNAAEKIQKAGGKIEIINVVK